ncbi:homoserine kinase [Bifidobacterium dolichotidis]|uniref:Homoserine kinase n=1 Tax=Bifidobacterium dolichotidis TaxID=2306976 RepID=A0A430FRL1_9BIFI|nr:homoserine kinase [Bifidobacterium dolichotidis]RSX55508.1 homoserine kinase [Bifidobacterium dolichotidis]
MTPVQRVCVQVPATSANLGSGFDTLGLALDYFDEVEFSLIDAAAPYDAQPSVIVDIEGEGEQTLPRDESHLVVRAFRQACERFGLGTFAIHVRCTNRIPQARGMGSSAEAIVAGVSAAAAFAGYVDVATGELTNRDLIFAVAAELEGHPDNVAPAVYGSMTASWKREASESVVGVAAERLGAGFRTVNYAVKQTMLASVFIPDFELSTSAARSVLPDQVPFGDAIANISHASLMPAVMATSSATITNALLFDATEDNLHQPYRLGLMPPSAELIYALREAGYAACVSGAGPCVLVLHDCAYLLEQGSARGAETAQDATTVINKTAENQAELKRVFAQAAANIDAAAAPQLDSGKWRVLHLPVNRTGVRVTAEPIA